LTEFGRLAFAPEESTLTPGTVDWWGPKTSSASCLHPQARGDGFKKRPQNSPTDETATAQTKRTVPGKIAPRSTETSGNGRQRQRNRTGKETLVPLMDSLMLKIPGFVPSPDQKTKKPPEFENDVFKKSRTASEGLSLGRRETERVWDGRGKRGGRRLKNDHQVNTRRRGPSLKKKGLDARPSQKEASPVGGQTGGLPQGRAKTAKKTRS